MTDPVVELVDPDPEPITVPPDGPDTDPDDGEAPAGTPTTDRED